MTMSTKLKVICTLFIMGIVTCLAGCGEDKPEDVVSNVFDCMKDNHMENLHKYIVNESEDDKEDETSKEDKVAFEVLQECLYDYVKEYSKDIVYEIKDTNEKNETAEVRVKVKYKDAEEIVRRVYNDVTEEIITKALYGEYDEDDIEQIDMIEMFVKGFKKIQDDESPVDKKETMTLKCKKVDGKWKVIYDDKIGNVYLCNILDSLSKVIDSSSEDEESDKAEDKTTEENETKQKRHKEDTTKGNKNDKDKKYYYDEGNENIKVKYTVWDDSTELIVDMEYTGVNDKNQKVGNSVFTMRSISQDGDDKVDTVNWTFVENPDRTGTVYYSNGKSLDYSIITKDDHDDMVMNIDGEDYEFMEYEWAHKNVGQRCNHIKYKLIWQNSTKKKLKYYIKYTICLKCDIMNIVPAVLAQAGIK